MDQRPVHVADDGSIYRVAPDGKLEGLPVEEAQAVRESLERAQAEHARRHLQGLHRWRIPGASTEESTEEEK